MLIKASLVERTTDPPTDCLNLPHFILQSIILLLFKHSDKDYLSENQL